MEDPGIHYEDFQIISAKSPELAKEFQDISNNASFYYGEVIAEVVSENEVRNAQEFFENSQSFISEGLNTYDIVKLIREGKVKII